MSEKETEELTEAQQLRLQESLQQVKDGKTHSHEEVMERVKEWRSQLEYNLHHNTSQNQ